MAGIHYHFILSEMVPNPVVIINHKDNTVVFANRPAKNLYRTDETNLFNIMCSQTHFYSLSQEDDLQTKLPVHTFRQDFFDKLENQNMLKS